MKILVCIKQVPDTETKIKLLPDGQQVDTNGVKWVMNPYDEIAVEEALKLKEANADSKVITLSLGPKKRISEVLRTSLAMGADEAVSIDGPESLDYFSTAKALSKYISDNHADVDIILTGKLAIDDNASSVSQALAELLNLPHTTVVSKHERQDGLSIVEREVEGGKREVVQLNGPSVLAANKGLNTPRYATVRGIMMAKKKTVHEASFDELGLSEAEKTSAYVNFKLPAEKPPVKMIDGEAPSQASELVRMLREDSKVI